MSSYDKNGKLTRESAEKIINAGGSVLIDGKTITRVKDLPEAKPVKESK